MKPNYPKSVKEAAKALDKLAPGWHKKIIISTLDMEDTHHCILGQVFGDFDKGMKLFSVSEHDNPNGDTIFGWRAAVSVWEEEIEERNKFLTFLEALQAIKDGKKVKSLTNEIFHEKDEKLYIGNVHAPYIFLNSLWAEKYTIYELTFGDLEAGDKFTRKGEQVVFTKLHGNLALDNGYRTFPVANSVEVVKV